MTKIEINLIKKLDELRFFLENNDDNFFVDKLKEERCKNERPLKNTYSSFKRA